MMPRRFHADLSFAVSVSSVVCCLALSRGFDHFAGAVSASRPCRGYVTSLSATCIV